MNVFDGQGLVFGLWVGVFWCRSVNALTLGFDICVLIIMLGLCTR